MAQAYQVVVLGDGGKVDHTPGSAVASGDVVVTNGLFGYATQDIPASTLGSLQAAGGPHIRVVKINGALSVGNAVYWDAAGNPEGGVAASGAATATAGSNTFVGRVVRAAAIADEFVDVDATIGVVTAGTLENGIADPGDTNAIPVTASGIVPLVSLGIETRTLAAPAAVGLQLVLNFKTDGGNIVVTCATGVKQAASTTITFTDTGEFISLLAVEQGGNLRWREQANDGAAVTA